MKTKAITFFILKFIILQFVNLIAFAAALLIDTVSGFLIGNPFQQTAFVCCASFIIFCGYIYFSTAKMKESPLPPSLFILKESAAYMIFMIIPTVAAMICGAENITNNPLLRFYLPNLPLTHLTGYPILGFILQTLIVTLVSVQHTQKTTECGKKYIWRTNKNVRKICVMRKS